MPAAKRIPPGRAGRLWLHRHLSTAQRGRDQLDRKLRILVPERQLRWTQAEQCGAEWLRTCEEARTWLLRVSLLGGQDAVRAASVGPPLQVEISWATAMGLRYPDSVTFTGAGPEPPYLGNAAVRPAAAAFRAAMLAGARTAAAQEALRRIDEEIGITRRRVRALDKRWIPWLRASLASLDLALEQAEQDDGARLRRTTSTGPR